MTLTGVPLLALVLVVAAGTVTATVRGWRRRSPALRAIGLLLSEALVVAGAGLAVNHHEDFFPSWGALAGRTGTRTVTQAVRPGRLDGRLTGGAGTGIAWRPADLARWRLAAVPRVVVPADYAARPGVTFPVILALVPAPGPALATARRIDGAVTVIAVPTPATTAAALRSLPEQLSRDVRVTTRGWDLAATGRQAALAGALARTGPPGFVVARGWAPEQLSAPLAAPMRLPS